MPPPGSGGEGDEPRSALAQDRLDLLELLRPETLITILIGLAAFATVLTVTSPFMQNDELKKRMKIVSAERSNLRANQPYDIPILMLTARGRDTEVAKGLALGADGYMTKPFSTNELLARIRAVLRRRAEAALAMRRRHGTRPRTSCSRSRTALRR